MNTLAEMNSLAIRHPQSVIDSFLAGRNPLTKKAYLQDLASFCEFLQTDTIGKAAEIILSAGPGRANEIGILYKAHLIDKGLSPATINRRLAALRALIKFSRLIGACNFILEVENVPSRSFRNTRGLGTKNFCRILTNVRQRRDPKSIRDFALLRILWDLSLRRIEAANIDIGDVNTETGVVWIRGKARTEKEPMTMPTATREALNDWLEWRGTDPGPLFVSFHHSRHSYVRLTGNAMGQIVKALGREIGIDLHPHSIRHSSISAALEATGDLRAVQKFARHRDINTTTIYLDNLNDQAFEVASKVAAIAAA
jgi:integrase/recombinase XerC